MKTLLNLTSAIQTLARISPRSIGVDLAAPSRTLVDIDSPAIARLNRLQRLAALGGFDPHKYKAPHAYRGTPAKGPRRVSTILPPRLFTGHRI